MGVLCLKMFFGNCLLFDGSVSVWFVRSLSYISAVHVFPQSGSCPSKAAWNPPKLAATTVLLPFPVSVRRLEVVHQIHVGS